MSGVLHPTGPEPARTYWVRRAALLAVVLLLAVGVVFAVASLTKAAVATAPPPALPPTANPSTSPSATGVPSTPARTSSPAPSAGSSGSPSVAPSSAAKPSGSTSAKPSASASVTHKPSPTTTVVATPACRPADLRATLKGDRTLSPGQNNTFTLSLTNGGPQTCLTSVTGQNFELKIYSGKDRIWSSQDCAKRLASFDKVLAAQGTVAWKMAWDGERSVKGKSCQRGTDTPRAGTYWATAQLKGADPVQLRMIVS